MSSEQPLPSCASELSKYLEETAGTIPGDTATGVKFILRQIRRDRLGNLNANFFVPGIVSLEKALVPPEVRGEYLITAGYLEDSKQPELRYVSVGAVKKDDSTGRYTTPKGYYLFSVIDRSNGLTNPEILEGKDRSTIKPDNSEYANAILLATRMRIVAEIFCKIKKSFAERWAGSFTVIDELPGSTSLDIVLGQTLGNSKAKEFTLGLTGASVPAEEDSIAQDYEMIFEILKHFV